MTAGGPSKCKTSRGMSHKSRSRRPAKPRSYAPIFAALGDETRLALVARLARGEAHSISQLTAGTRLTRQAVTKHLRALEDAGIVHGRRTGRAKVFAFDPQPMDGIKQYLDFVSSQWDRALARLKQFTERPR